VSPKPPAGKVAVHVYITEDTDRRVRHKVVDLRRSLSSCAEEAWLMWLAAQEEERRPDA